MQRLGQIQTETLRHDTCREVNDLAALIYQRDAGADGHKCRIFLGPQNRVRFPVFPANGDAIGPLTKRYCHGRVCAVTAYDIAFISEVLYMT